MFFKKEFSRDYIKSEDGNVLFLILIAVALFAALSYAVTSSTRSGGGDASSETTLISSAQITQYPSSVSTAIVRMIIAGTAVEDIRFNVPSEFSSTSVNTTNPELVFHPAGGGATYNPAPADVMVSGNVGQWAFNADLELTDIGISGVGGNDVVAYLVGIKKAICSKINKEHGISSTGVIPVSAIDHSTELALRMVDTGTNYDFVTLDAANNDDISDAGSLLDGKPFGCFQNLVTLDYVYYHAIVER